MSKILSAMVGAVGDKAVAEVGGAHNQKGIEFQRNWAVLEMFALEEQPAADFLFLFEALQDVAVLDSADQPTKITLCQIKKKDRGEWTWAALTKLSAPQKAGKPVAKKAKPLGDIAGSPFGRLFSAIQAMDGYDCEGRFVSNAGCDLELADGTNAATTTKAPLSSLPPTFVHQLADAIKTLPKGKAISLDLSKLTIERSDLSVDDPLTYAIGKAHMFLLKRSPKHAGQARSFVEGMLVHIGPLGAKTAVCKTIDELKQQHGFTRQQFLAALASLEQVPDLAGYLDTWLTQLHAEGMSFMHVTRLRMSITGIYRRQVMGVSAAHEDVVVAACDGWLAGQDEPNELRPFFEAALLHLKQQFGSMQEADLQAHLALRAIRKCVAPN